MSTVPSRYPRGDDRLRYGQQDRESRRVIRLCGALMTFCALAFAFAISALMAI
jgi:hypothetical protein